ncbi:hypothetical protein ACHBHP_004910, partial [Escherichia coli]
ALPLKVPKSISVLIFSGVKESPVSEASAANATGAESAVARIFKYIDKLTPFHSFVFDKYFFIYS